MKKRSKAGFTLLEIMIVVAIISVLVAILIPTVKNATVKSRAAANAANMRTVESKLSQMRATHPEKFDAWVDQLTLATPDELEAIGSFIIDLIGGAGTADRLNQAFHKVTAINGTLRLQMSPDVEISAPPAKGVEVDGFTLAAGTQMSVYLGEKDIVVRYGNYTKNDFADIAEDGKYDGYTEADDGIWKTCPNCGEKYLIMHLFCNPTTPDDGDDETPESTEPTTGGGTNPCVTPDTLITLADGSQKPIANLTYNDHLLVWNFYTGSYDATPVSLIIDHGYDEQEIIVLKFSDGTSINFVTVHAAFDANLNRYVDISASNVAAFVGHNFVKMSNRSCTTVELIDYEVKHEYNGAISLLSDTHYNAILNGMLTISPSLEAGSLYEPFEVCAGMKYDAAQVQKDIETYGQYTYDDFSDYVTYEQFEAFGLANAKVSVGKGHTTYEALLAMLQSFAVPFL